MTEPYLLSTHLRRAFPITNRTSLITKIPRVRGAAASSAGPPSKVVAVVLCTDDRILFSKSEIPNFGRYISRGLGSASADRKSFVDGNPLLMRFRTDPDVSESEHRVNLVSKSESVL